MNKSQLLQSLKQQGFSSKIIDAFDKVKREDFIDENLKQYAYLDEPLPISQGQTISQPYTIAFMLKLLELDLLDNKINNINKSKTLLEMKRGLYLNNKEKNKIPNNKTKILEIGSGSGYVLALINEISKNSQIYGVERIEELVEKSSNVLKGKKNIKIIYGDGSKGLKKYAPYDRILISASANKIPTHLYSQLKNNGMMVYVVQNSIYQIKRKKLKLEKKEFPGFIFVPLVEDRN